MKRKINKGGGRPQKKVKAGDDNGVENTINVKLFRKKLQGDDFISDYHQFLQAALVNPTLLADYLAEGGQAFEIVQSFDKIDANSLAHISCMLQVLQLILIEIISNSPDGTSVAVNACGYLLKKHRQCIINLLKSTVDKNKRAALKALTAIVALDERLAYEVIKLFNSTIKSDYQLQHLTKYGEAEDGETVRTCYIHFVMAYLVEGKLPLIQSIVGRPKLLKSLLLELHLDSEMNIMLVLGSLKNFVVKNALVPKMQKMEIFDVSILNTLAKLYKYEKKEQEDDDMVDAEAVERVRASVHDFLTLLLTSYRYGIALRCMGEKQQNKYNGGPREVLRGIKEPWADDRLNHLASQILKACPELCENYFASFKRQLETDKEELFVDMLSFFQHVTNLLTPKVVLRAEALQTMSTREVVRITQTICLHSDIFEKIKAKGLKHSSYIIRLITSNHLRVQLRQLSEYFRALETFPGLPNVKLQIFEYIFQFYPPVDAILNMLYQTINDKALTREDVLVHIECVLDILLHIVDLIPAFIEKTSSVVNYLQILSPIYSDAEIDAERRNVIEQKTIKLMLLLDPQALSTDSEIFKQLFGSLMNVYLGDSVEAKRAAKMSLRDILLKSGVFEGGSGEIDVWLMSFRSLPHLDVVKDHFVRGLLKAKKSSEEQEITIDSGSVEEEEGNIQKILKNIERGDTIDGSFDVPISSTMLRTMMTGGGGKQMNHVDKYLDDVLLRLIHFHPKGHLNTFGRLFEKRKLLAENYLQSWFTANSFVAPDATNYPIANQLFENIKKGKYETIEELEKVDSSQLITHVHEILFLLNQLIRLGKCTSETVETSSKYLLDILNAIHEQEKNFENSEASDLIVALRYIFQCQVELFQNWKGMTAQKKDVNLTPLIVEVVQFARKSVSSEIAEQLTRNYRRKMLKEFEAVKGEISQEQFYSLDAFEFVQEEKMQLLDSLRSLKKPIDINLTAHIVSKMIEINHETTTKRVPMSKENINYVQRVVFEFASEKSVDEDKLNGLCEKLLDFLQTFQSNSEIDFQLIELFYGGEKQSKAITKLLTFLVRKLFPQNKEEIYELIGKNYQKKEVTYPLLNEIVSDDLTLEKDLLTRLFQEYKSGIIKSIEKPNKAGLIYKECPAVSNYLLNKAMPIKECQEFCRKVVKSDTVESFQVDLLRTMHTKAIVNSPETDPFIQNFVANMMNFLHLQLKKSDSLNVDYLMEVLTNWLRTHRATNRNWEEMCETMNWATLVKSCLKTGMNEKGSEMRTNPQDLLLLLAVLIEEFYPEGEYPDIGEYYSLALTHSQFFNIMLEKEFVSFKYPLARLLLAMGTRSVKTSFHKRHVPIFLGAYSAKLNQCDRVLLALINLYERSGISLAEFQPFLWGDAAISHYSLMGMESFETIKSLEATSADEVFSLVDPEVMKYSLSNYPIWRDLNPMRGIDDIEFGKTETGLTKLERIVDEKKVETLSNVDKKLVHRRENIYENCYDPAFFIPLTSFAFCPGLNSSAVVAAQNGMLAMSFEALSSYDVNMRQAAGLALSRYRRQMQGKKAFLDVELWNQFFFATSKGLQDITPKSGDVPRMSHISALFLGKVSIILTQPLVKLYNPLSAFVTRNESYDLSLVPHFEQLFLNPDLEHHVYREFILEIIQDGIKCLEDFDILDMGGILEVLLVFFSCPFANISTNLRILNIVNVIVRIPSANKILIEKYCIIAWLSGIIANLEPYYFDTVEALVHLLWNMYYAVQAVRGEFNNVTEVELKLFQLVRKLVKVMVVGHSSLKTSWKLRVYEKMVKLVRRLTEDNVLALRSISDDELVHWIDMGRSHFVDVAAIVKKPVAATATTDAEEEEAGVPTMSAPQRAQIVVNELLYVKENLHMEFVESDVEFRQRLSLQENDVRTAIVLELRRLVIAWTKCSSSSNL